MTIRPRRLFRRLFVRLFANSRRRLFAVALGIVAGIGAAHPALTALNVTNLSGFMAGGSGATVTFTASAVDSVDRSTYTYTSQSIGTEAADRIVVVAVTYTTTASISSVTINLVSATQVVAATGSGGQKIELWKASVPTGTSVTIIVVHPGTSDRGSIGVWAVYGASSTTYDTGSKTAADPLSDTVNIPTGGVVIAAAANNDAGTDTYTWTGLDENYDALVEDPTDHSGASRAFESAETGYTVTANESSASTAGALVIGVWGP